MIDALAATATGATSDIGVIVSADVDVNVFTATTITLEPFPIMPSSKEASLTG